MLRTLAGILDAAGLPRVRFHDLRHSAASLLIAAGVELSMLVGHSDLRVTADLYSHLQKQTAAKASARIRRVPRNPVICDVDVYALTRLDRSEPKFSESVQSKKSRLRRQCSRIIRHLNVARM